MAFLYSLLVSMSCGAVSGADLFSATLAKLQMRGDASHPTSDNIIDTRVTNSINHNNGSMV